MKGKMALSRLASLFAGSKLAVATRLVRLLYFVVFATTVVVGAYNAIYGSTAAMRESSTAVADILANGPASVHWKEACETGEPAPVCAAPLAARDLSNISLPNLG